MRMIEVIGKLEQAANAEEVVAKKHMVNADGIRKIAAAVKAYPWPEEIPVAMGDKPVKADKKVKKSKRKYTKKSAFWGKKKK